MKENLKKLFKVWKYSSAVIIPILVGVFFLLSDNACEQRTVFCTHPDLALLSVFYIYLILTGIALVIAIFILIIKSLFFKKQQPERNG